MKHEESGPFNNLWLLERQKGEVHCFTERMVKAQLKSTKEEKDFWTAPDPNIDAWMLTTGRKRDVFDLPKFVKENRNILDQVQSARKLINVLVLSS